jgi:hypothetical protein
MTTIDLSSDDPRIRSIVVAIKEAAEAALTAAEWEGPVRDMALCMALTACVWESGAKNSRIPITATSALMNMAVDAGFAEEIGMVQMSGSPETLQ